MNEESLVYAAYVGFCLGNLIPDNDDEMYLLFDNLGMMVRIATVAYFHEFKNKGDKIDKDAMFKDGLKDACDLYRNKLEGRL